MSNQRPSLPPPNPAPASHRGRFISGFLMAAGGLLLLLAAIVLFMAVQKSQQIVSSVTQPLAKPQPTAAVSTAAVIVQQLRRVSDLTTAVSTIETVVDASQDRTLGPIPIGHTKMLYVAHGDVRAGVDLSQLGAKDITVNDHQLAIRLPPPTIQDKKVDVARSYVYNVENSFFAPPEPELQSRAERFALDKIVRAACEGGILDAANSHARLAVSALLTATSPYSVTIVTQPAAADACPPAATATP
jgi:hypothetical protein